MTGLASQHNVVSIKNERTKAILVYNFRHAKKLVLVFMHPLFIFSIDSIYYEHAFLSFFFFFAQKDRFEVYAPYCSNHERAQKKLNELSEQQEFQGFVLVRNNIAKVMRPNYWRATTLKMKNALTKHH